MWHFKGFWFLLYPSHMTEKNPFLRSELSKKAFKVRGHHTPVGGTLLTHKYTSECINIGIEPNYKFAIVSWSCPFGQRL